MSTLRLPFHRGLVQQSFYCPPSTQAATRASPRAHQTRGCGRFTRRTAPQGPCSRDLAHLPAGQLRRRPGV